MAMAISSPSWRMDLNIVSATNIANVRGAPGASMKVYAIVSINGAPSLTYSTPVDYFNGTNPRWNTAMPYNVPYRAAGNHGNNLCVTLYYERSFGAHGIVGYFNCSLRQLFQIRVPNGYREYSVGLNTGFGTLRFRYRFLLMCPVISTAIHPSRKHVVDRQHSVLRHGIRKPFFGSNNAPGVQLYALIGEYNSMHAIWS